MIELATERINERTNDSIEGQNVKIQTKFVLITYNQIKCQINFREILCELLFISEFISHNALIDVWFISSNYSYIWHWCHLVIEPVSYKQTIKKKLNVCICIEAYSNYLQKFHLQIQWKNEIEGI